MGLRWLACWDYGFESRRVRGCFSPVSVVCCQVEVPASGWSLVHGKKKVHPRTGHQAPEGE
jgi:hypothetical protein